jgi:hypothetical protein
MHKVSASFLNGLRQSHRVVSSVSIYPEGDMTVQPLVGNVVSGQVSIDRTQQVRRTASVTLASEVAIPLVLSNALNPYTARVLIRRGLRYGDGIVETVPLGLFIIDDMAWNADQTQLDLSLTDLTALAIRATIVPVRVVSSGSTLAVISSLLAEVFKTTVPSTLPPPIDNLLVDQNVVDAALSGYEISSEDRWEHIADLALRLGAEVYADYESSKFRVVPIPKNTGTPVWSVNAGPGGVLVNYARSVSRVEVVNAVYATNGEAEDSATAPVAAWAYDSNPTSDTYVGRYGWAIAKISSSAYNTTTKASNAAKAYLESHLGLVNTLDLTTVPNPALQAGDVIEVVYPDGRIENHIVDALDVGLSQTDDFTISTRSTQAVLAVGTARTFDPVEVPGAV